MTPIRSRFLVKLLASYALLVVVNAVLAEFFVSRWVEREAGRELEESLAAQATLLVDAVQPLTAPESEAALQRRVEELGAATSARFTVVAPDGRVLADSAEQPAAMENHLGRREFVEAAAKGRGVDERVSATTGQRTRYVCLAVPGRPGGVGFVRAALPFPSLQRRTGRIRETVIAGVAVGTALAIALAVLVARRLTRPLTEMTRAAVALAEGGPAAPPIRHESADELGELARAFNRMSVRLRERVADVERERAKIATVLESMAEGVVAVDAEERLIHCNASARAMLSIAGGVKAGAPLVERVRTPELVDALRRAQGRGEAAGVPQIEEVRLHASGRERVISIHAAPLADRGAVAVLLDVTELRRLETVRRDFVANVSHEIKTPLAAMRGLVETLVEDDAMDPAVRRRFLGKLEENVRRLTDLASDLLQLSRAESDRPQPRVAVDLPAAAAAACERFAAAAGAKRIALRCEAAAAPALAAADPEAVGQILDNLLDNAIKYTPPGGQVSVRASEAGERALLEVADNGIGIEPSEQKRVFERFYRVDKARSRDVPGTGLGLSIVKHLVERHGGAIELESWPGRGSTFRVLLPRSASPLEATPARANPDS